MKLRLFAALLALAGNVLASERSSANYSITSESLVGGRSGASANYSQVSAFGEIGGPRSSGDFFAKPGFAGQLYEIVSLTIAAMPGGIAETQSASLTALGVGDDGTFTPVPGASVAWSIVSGPLTDIATDGLATAGVVAQDTPAIVAASWSGLSAQLGITVRETIPDNFGLYAGDGLGDVWQVQYFGANNPLAAASLDPDGDGQTNRFEFAAGLAPTEPASRFAVRIATVPSEPAKRAIIIRPRFLDRIYTVEFRTSLTTGVWSPLPSFTTSDNGDERTIIDSGPVSGARFYRVKIESP